MTLQSVIIDWNCVSLSNSQRLRQFYMIPEYWTKLSLNISSSSKYAGGSHRFNIFRLFDVFRWVRSKYRKFLAQESSKTARFLLFCNAQSTEMKFYKMKNSEIAKLTFVKFEKLHFGDAKHEFIRFINSFSDKLWCCCGRCGSGCCRCSSRCRCSCRSCCCGGCRCSRFRLNYYD